MDEGIVEIISREEARERGLKRYFTGTPCKHGHISERYVGNRCCASCTLIAAMAYDAAHPDAAKKRIKSASQKNKEAYRLKRREYLDANRDRVRQQGREHDKKRRENPEFAKAKAEREKHRYHSDQSVRERALARSKTPEYRESQRARRQSHDYKEKSALYEKNRASCPVRMEFRAERARQRRQHPEVKKRHAEAEKARRERMKDDPLYILARRVRGRITQAFSRNGFSKRSKTAEIVGCSWEELKSHIERQFLKGMSWENRHLWHIDHIVPLSTAKTEADVISLNHVSNLRPLWGSDNLKKSKKIVFLI